MARITLGALTVIDVHGRRMGEGGRREDNWPLYSAPYKAYTVNNGIGGLGKGKGGGGGESNWSLYSAPYKAYSGQ